MLPTTAAIPPEVWHSYVRMEREVDGIIESTDQKHIMRYQQFFAALAIREKLDQGITSGVVWHTQGSGKTALAYHLNLVLTDYYARHQKVAKFYFIVDRLDLLEQASQESRHVVSRLRQRIRDRS